MAQSQRISGKKGDRRLEQSRSMELTAIHQYMNQHYNLDDMDYGDLAAKVKLIAIDEMRHAEMFAERIKELGGEPTTGLDGKVEKGQHIESVFPFDAKLEDDTIDGTINSSSSVGENGDSISMKLFETIVDEEQIHYNYFDTVSDHIKKLGAAYLARLQAPGRYGGTRQGFVTDDRRVRHNPFGAFSLIRENARLYTRKVTRIMRLLVVEDDKKISDLIAKGSNRLASPLIMSWMVRTVFTWPYGTL
jgi:bacterioferritin